MSIRLTLLVLTAVSAACSSGNGSSTIVGGEVEFASPANFHGEWDVAVTVLTSPHLQPSEWPYVSRTAIKQEASMVVVGSYGSMLSPDNNGNVIGMVTDRDLRLTRNDGFTDLTLTMADDGSTFRGTGSVRFDNTGTGIFGGAVLDAEVLVTASPSFPTTAQMWLNFENGLWDASSHHYSGLALGDFTIDETTGARSQQSGTFDGVGDGVWVRSGLTTNAGRPFSFGVWVWPESLGPHQTILAKSPDVGAVTGGLRTPRLYLDAGQVVFGYNNGESVSGSVVAIGAWSHIGVTYDGATTHTIYINGTEVSTNASMPAANEGQNGEDPWRLTVGKDYRTAPFGYEGNIDDVTYWTRALSRAEMQVLHSSGPVGM